MPYEMDDKLVSLRPGLSVNSLSKALPERGESIF